MASAPTSPLSPVEKLTERVSNALPSGKVTIRADQSVLIEWAEGEALTAGLGKDALRRHIVAAVGAVHAAGLTGYGEIYVTATVPLTDTYGNTKPETVLQASYSEATADQINFSQADESKMLLLADGDVYVHPALIEGSDPATEQGNPLASFPSG